MNSRRPVVALAVTALLLVAFAAGAAMASNNLKSWTNPDEGLSAEEVRAAHEANSNEFWKRYAKWIDEQNKTGRDPRTYPVTEDLAVTADPPSTLAEAVRLAELVVTGDVTGVEFRASADSVVHVRVSAITKGTADSSIDVLLPAALMPQDAETWSPAIVQLDAIPMLYAGDKVVLFLSPEPASGGLLTPQPWTGIYMVRDEQLTAVPGSRLSPVVDGLTLEAFLSTLESH